MFDNILFESENYNEYVLSEYTVSKGYPKSLDYGFYVNELSSIAEKYSENMRFYSIGQSVEGRDIYAAELIDRDATPTAEIYIIAGQHGNEPAGPAAAYEFIKKYLESDTQLAEKMKKSVKITVVTIVNVDQFVKPLEERGYNNANNIDLNSSYRHITNKVPEVEAVVNDFRDTETGVDLAFDLHETGGSWMNGFVLYENKPKRREKLELGKKAVERVSEKYSIHNDGIIHDLNPNCFDGFAAQNNSYSYTFETPMTNFKFEERIEMDLIALDTIIASYYRDIL